MQAILHNGTSEYFPNSFNFNYRHISIIFNVYLLLYNKKRYLLCAQKPNADDSSIESKRLYLISVYIKQQFIFLQIRVKDLNCLFGMEQLF